MVQRCDRWDGYLSMESLQGGRGGAMQMCTCAVRSLSRMGEKHRRVQRTLFSGSHRTLGPRSSQWLADEPTTAQASVAHTTVAPHTFPRLAVVCQRRSTFSPQSRTACGSLWMILRVRPTLDQEQNLQEEHRKTTKTTCDCLHTAPW